MEKIIESYDGRGVNPLYVRDVIGWKSEEERKAYCWVMRKMKKDLGTNSRDEAAEEALNQGWFYIDHEDGGLRVSEEAVE